MGPATLNAAALDVRPHPHIGLATLTYLLEGEIMHRDSLGSVQAIRPGEVNWMTAGRGITHSERTPEALRGQTSTLFGLQCWLALPVTHEETAPEFFHYGADAIPATQAMARLTLIAGTLEGGIAGTHLFGCAVRRSGAGAGRALSAGCGPHRARLLCGGRPRARGGRGPFATPPA
jgi:redox-sensitive bicupin YhaK (pirin superfamily)